MSRKADRPLGRTEETFDATAANSERADKLRRNGLRRRARAKGLELRHSDNGYSLITGQGERIESRSNLTLNDVEKLLKD